MSLINDALKRAQRQRTAEEAGINPPMPGGSSGRVTKRGKPLSAQSLLLIVVGATVLIVLSVVATVYLVRDTPKPAAAASTAADPTVQAGAGLGLKKTSYLDSAPSLVVFVPSPVKTEPAVVTPSESASAPVAPQPAQTATATANPSLPAVNPTASQTARPAAVTRPAPDPTLPADERVNLFLDKLHVTGIRSSGNESKVLMNDRVYRVNDIVDRTLGLRLTQVRPGVLTFADERGVVYTKNF